MTMQTFQSRGQVHPSYPVEGNLSRKIQRIQSSIALLNETEVDAVDAVVQVFLNQQELRQRYRKLTEEEYIREAEIGEEQIRRGEILDPMEASAFVRSKYGL